MGVETIFYANENMQDIGVLKGFKLDMSISMEKGDNDFEVRTFINGIEMNEGYYIYAENSEYGGIVDAKRINTKDKTLYYSGRTWRGMLESKIIVPPEGQDYYVVGGDLNAVIEQLINDFDLSDLFYVDSSLTGETVSNYQFYRYTDVYSGIIRMLSNLEYKLVIEFDVQRLKCKLSAVPITDYGENQEVTSDLYDFDIKQVRGTVNHLIGLGAGELKDRLVLHKYADENGVISDTQTLFGKDEVVSIYDYSSAEDANDLEESMVERFRGMIGSDSIQITLYDINADVGDKLTAYEEKTHTEAVQYVQRKIITIDDDTIKTQYSAKTVKISNYGESRQSGGGGGTPIEITIDSQLSNTSKNPVQNKVINTALGNKANLASPTFTGTPKAPTAGAATDNTQIATTAFVHDVVDDVTETIENTSIDGVSFDMGDYIDMIHYGECSTAASTVAKTVACTNFKLIKGSWIAVKFTVTNTGAVASLTLNVNSTGAKSIKYRGGNLPSTATLTAKRIYLFVYDGTNYELIGDLDTNTTYINMSQSEATTGTATNARSISAKVLNDTIDGKLAGVNFPVDYIVEEGTWGNYGKYVKWNSGIAECFGYAYITSAINSTYGNAGICYKATSVTFPTGLFKAGPVINITIERTSGLLWASIYGSSATGANFYIGSATAESSAKIWFHVIAKGFWK